MLRNSREISLFAGKGGLFFSALLFLLLLNAGCTGPAPRIQEQVKSDNRTEAEKSHGIEVESIRITAAGYMVDFRYKAVDPEKAIALFGRDAQPYLLHEATGAVFTVPATKVGPLRQTTNPPVAGKGYFMLFGNPGRYIKPGDKVTLIFGDSRIEHLTVQ